MNQIQVWEHIDRLLREQTAVAQAQHEIWAHWMRYLFGVCSENADGSVTIPADKAVRWKRQVDTAYDDLTEREQKSDLEQADKVFIALHKAHSLVSTDASLQ